MPWFPLALTTACLTAIQDLLGKKSLQSLDAAVVTGLLGGISALVLGGLLWAVGMPPLQPGFWWILLANGSLNTLGFWTYNRALQLGDLSLTAPIVAFSPLFFFLTSPLIVGEYPTSTDFVGSVLVVLGSYGLNWQQRHQGYWAPFKALWTQRGSRLMLGVALIWSVTANLDKVGVLHSSPLCWVFAVYSFVTLGMGVTIALQGNWASHWEQLRPGGRNNQGRSPWVYLLPMGICSALAVALQMYALTLTLVVRVIAVKRLSTLMGVVLGVVFLQEQGLRHRLLGAGLMVAGVAVLLQ